MSKMKNFSKLFNTATVGQVLCLIEPQQDGTPVVVIMAKHQERELVNLRIGYEGEVDAQWERAERGLDAITHEQVEESVQAAFKQLDDLAASEASVKH